MVLLFDFWGVIGRIQPRHQVEAMADLLGVSFDEFAAAYWAEREPYDAGGTADAFWSNMAARLGRSLSRDLVADLVHRDTGSWRTLDEAMVQLLDALSREGRRLALLSNAPRELADFVRASAVAPFLSQMLFSCDIGFAKPHAGIYAAAIKALDVAPQEILFIDDRPVNVEAALLSGMRGLVHTSAAATEAALRSLDV